MARGSGRRPVLRCGRRPPPRPVRHVRPRRARHARRAGLVALSERALAYLCSLSAGRLFLQPLCARSSAAAPARAAAAPAGACGAAGAAPRRALLGPQHPCESCPLSVSLAAPAARAACWATATTPACRAARRASPTRTRLRRGGLRFRVPRARGLLTRTRPRRCKRRSTPSSSRTS